MSETNGMIKKRSSLSPIVFFTVVLSTLFLLLTNPGSLHAQSMPDMRPTDSLTLALYNNQSWDELIDAGTQAIHQDLDYYYLRMRVGIAYYEKQNFRLAIAHFEKALKFNPVSQATIEYLYFSYLQSGRKYDAQKIALKLSDERKQKIGIDKNQFLDFAYFETGSGAASKGDLKNWMNKPKAEHDTIYSKVYFSDDLYYLHGGVNLRIHPNISLYQGYSKVTVSLQQRIDYQNVPWPEYKSRVFQHEYYGNMVLNIPSGIKVTSAWHLLWVDYDDRKDKYNDTLYILEADTLNVKNNDCTFLLSVRKDFNLFAIQADASYGNFGRRNLKQIGLLFYTYPFGNLNVFTETGLIKIWDQRDRDDWIFHQLVGVKLLPRLWFEASGTFGNLKDYNEGFAFTVYNTADAINYKLEGNLIFNISKHLELSLRGRYMQQEANYLYFRDVDTPETINKDYGYFSMIGGIKWKL